ncbi:MAG TPA: hypothetical protein VFB17_01960, partial [Gaiellaceae bacterium]|nr:hypothetical protein [Gaiellaceae bacterium]
PRFAEVLSPHGLLAIVHRTWIGDPKLRRLLDPVYARYAANPDFEPLDLVDELERRELFSRKGKRAVAADPWRPTVGELIACHHSQSGFVLEKMDDPAGFDRALAEVATTFPAGTDGRLELDVAAEIVWGRPNPR